MRPGGGHSKGSSFERDMSKELSLWWTNGESKNVFWRTHGSGAMGTRGGNVAECGDMMAITEVGMPFTKKYHIEIRFSKALDLGDILYNLPNSGIVSFINESLLKAKHSNRIPILLFKEHKRPILLATFFEEWMEEEFKDKVMLDCKNYNMWLFVTWDSWKSSKALEYIRKGVENKV